MRDFPDGSLRRVIDALQAICIIGGPIGVCEVQGQGAIDSMNKSPWSAYGRREENGADAASSAKPDPTLGAVRELMRTQAQLKSYLDRTFREYNEIRDGRAGYAAIVAEALKPSPVPETIEERLRRLSGAQQHIQGHRGGSSSAV